MTFDHWKSTNPADEFLGDCLPDIEPVDAHGPEEIEHYLREDFEDLRRFVGFERARQIVAEIINDAACATNIGRNANNSNVIKDWNEE